MTAIDGTGTSAAQDHTSSVSVTTGTSGVPTGSSTGSDAGTAGFISYPDGGDPSMECSQWLEDCPRGEKCMPWSMDGSATWNATKCVPIAKDPRAPGEPCSVVGSPHSGVDDCDLHAMCWDVDPETSMGRCVAMCIGSEGNPSCEDPCEACSVLDAGLPNPCLAPCDPLAMDCPDDLMCSPHNSSYWCVPDLSPQGTIGDECASPQDCEPGLFCAEAARVPGCAARDGCCTPVCDVDAPDGCDGTIPGSSCMLWYPDGGTFDDCFPHRVGACLVPE